MTDPRGANGVRAGRTRCGSSRWRSPACRLVARGAMRSPSADDRRPSAHRDFRGVELDPTGRGGARSSDRTAGVCEPRTRPAAGDRGVALALGRAAGRGGLRVPEDVRLAVAAPALLGPLRPGPDLGGGTGHRRWRRFQTPVADSMRVFTKEIYRVVHKYCVFNARGYGRVDISYYHYVCFICFVSIRISWYI